MMATLKRTACRVALLGAIAAFGASAAQAAPMIITDPGLPGTTQADAWTTASLSSGANPGYPGFPGSGSWPGPINSVTPNVGNNGDGQLNKVGAGVFGGGPFPSSSSLYFGSFDASANVSGGTVGVSDATPVAGVANVVFQVQIGEAVGFDFPNGVKPVLNYNGGSQALVATNLLVLEHLQNGTFDSPVGPQPIFVNTYLLQWDTSALGPITALSVTFSGSQHSQVYQLRLDQSNVFQAVPEPSSVTLAGMALLGAIGLVWKKRRGR
jgi:hypothetical protein